MDLFELMIEYYKENERQGPGSEEMTLKALNFLPHLDEKVKILDIGCGTGAQTITLALNTGAQITAIDMLPQFLEKLLKKVEGNNLTKRITVKEMLMDNLVIDDESLDVIWSEGAIYNIGFENGLSLWKKYLKDGGYIAVSEISWTTDTRPIEIEKYWNNAYPEIDTIENKISTLEKCGYVPIAHFELDEKCWTDIYYQPLLEKSEDFMKKYNCNDDVIEIIGQIKIEADMYNKYKDYYNYVFYIGKKSDTR